MLMSTAVAPEAQNLGVKDAPPAPPVSVTEKAAEEVRRVVADMQASGQVEAGSKLYLRVRVQGGGCSGFQNKLDLDAKFDEKTDVAGPMWGGAVAEKLLDKVIPDKAKPGGINPLNLLPK